MFRPMMMTAAALTGFMSVPALAQDADFRASAVIQNGLTVQKDADLNFANIVPDTQTSGLVAIRPDGRRLCADALTCTGESSPASFTVIGRQGAMYAVTVPGGADLTSGADTMRIDRFMTDLDRNSGWLTDGTDTFNLGARIRVQPNQAPGTYTGTFPVAVEYE
ncbi:MAG: DUF4402 domain-containing protein [Pseudomonadota bacterium]